MFVEYKGDEFEVAVQDDRWMLRKYIPVLGFEKGMFEKNGRMIDCYEKEVNIKDLGEFYDVMFCGKVKGSKYEYDLHNYNGRKVAFICSESTGAAENGYREIEDGMWIGYKELDDFEKLTLKKIYRGGKGIEEIVLTKSSFEAYWKKYHTELRLR